MSTTTTRWVGVAIACADAWPVARFYERLLPSEMDDRSPQHWAQLWDPAGARAPEHPRGENTRHWNMRLHQQTAATSQPVRVGGER